MRRKVSWVVLFLSAGAMAQGQDDGGLRSGPPVSDYAKQVEARANGRPETPFLQRLHDEAQRLKDARGGGVATWSALTRMAVDHYQGRPELTVEQQFDAVMRDLSAVLVGQSDMKKHIDGMRDHWVKFPGERDPLVDWLLSEYSRTPAGLRVTGLEPTDPETGQVITDFRPEFFDGTNNQVYHSSFYMFLSYFTGSSVTSILGSLHHELFDGGRSKQDDLVAQWAANLGRDTRKLRDAEKSNALDALPALIGAMFAKDPSSYGDPEQNGGRDLRDLVKTVDDHVSSRVDNPAGTRVGSLAQRVRHGLIEALAGTQRPLDKAADSYMGND